jgi:hypothetical protein
MVTEPGARDTGEADPPFGRDGETILFLENRVPLLGPML